MTPYLREIAHGGTSSIDAWNAHLVEFHRVYADATSLPLALMLARGRDPYEHAAALVAHAKPDATRVLDVGCGDGRLLRVLGEFYGPSLELSGIDLSENEIARARLVVPQAKLYAGDVRDAAFGTGRFDLIVGHLSFALVPRLHDVLARTHEWLVPRGVLAMVLEDPLTESSFFRAAAAAMHPVRRRFPSFSPLIPERVRCEDDAVLGVLLGDAGFTGPPSVERFALSARLTPLELWEILRRSYPFGLLPADLQQEAQRALHGALGDLGADGRTDVVLPLRCIVVAR